MTANLPMRMVPKTVGWLLVAELGYEVVSWLLGQEAVQVWLQEQYDSVENALMQSVDSKAGDLVKRVLMSENAFLTERIMSGVYSAYMEAYTVAPAELSLKEGPDGVVLIIGTPEEYADFMMMDYEEYAAKWPRVKPTDARIEPDYSYDVPEVYKHSAFGSWTLPPFAGRKAQAFVAVAGVLGALSFAAVVAYIGWRK